MKIYIPAEVRTAMLNIYNEKGEVMQNEMVNERGNIAKEITTVNFPSGNYLCSFNCDGIVTTVKMTCIK